MNPIAKMLIIGGALLILIGFLWQVGGRFLPIGKLPGDIVVEGKNYRFYFPIVTCIILSVVVSVIFYIVRLFK